MNKSLVGNLFALVLFAVSLPSMAFAEAIHDADNNAKCTVCHAVHKSQGSAGASGLNIICLNCHRQGSTDSRYGQIAPFVTGDMAAVSGPSRGVREAKKTKSSHRWEGSDNVPNMGASPPSDVQLSGGKKPNVYVGKLACARCHDVHYSSEEHLPRIPSSFTNDVVCLDCHIDRNTTLHTNGTHPVGVTYATAVAQHPNDYYPDPINANPANSTSAMALKNGTVLCTTCHSVHFADSNSSTFDNRSSAIFGRLSSSEGYLLKTDLRGANVNARNICTNCHRTTNENGIADSNPLAKVMNHNGVKNQNIQCADCHGGHVDEADGTTPNAYLIKRYMNVSSAAGRTPKVMFSDSTNYAKDAYGVCAACHLFPEGHYANKADTASCKGCHTHNKGFSANCDQCHGNPPVSASSGGAPINGYASVPFNYADPALGVYKDESKTPHYSHATPNNAATYSYSCAQCHKGNTHAIGAATFQDVFKVYTGLIARKKGAVPTYNAVAGTCSDMYCHSDGAGVPKPAIAWANGRGTLIGKGVLGGECSACHNFPATSTTHDKHVKGGTSGKSYSCSLCHSTVIDSSNVIINKSLHVNGTADVSFSGTEQGITVTACTSCHNSGSSPVTAPFKTPVWGDPTTGACGACHVYPMTNNGHAEHLTAANGPLFGTSVSACQECHTDFTEFGAQHVNGVRNKNTSKCLPCHAGTVPTWTASVTCQSCHGYTSTSKLASYLNISAPSTRLADTKGHGQANGANKACDQCHVSTGAHLDANPAVHVSRLNTDLAPVTPLNNQCNFCHNDSTTMNKNWPKYSNMSTHFTVYTEPGADHVAPPQAMACAKCHDLHGTSNNSMVRTFIAYTKPGFNNLTGTINFTDRTTKLVDHVTNRGLCQVCHTQTKYYKRNVPQPTGHPTEGCFTCHPHNAKGGAFFPSGGCNTCHGYPPVPSNFKKGAAILYGQPGYKTTFGVFNNYTDAKFEDYTGGGGAHLNHVPTYAKATEGWVNCAICHNHGNVESTPNHKTTLNLRDNVKNVTLNIAQYVNFNNSLHVSYTGAKLVNPPNNKSGTCVNVSCHFQKTPPWSAEKQ